jgi:hypothetical protein
VLTLGSKSFPCHLEPTIKNIHITMLTIKVGHLAWNNIKMNRQQKKKVFHLEHTWFSSVPDLKYLVQQHENTSGLCPKVQSYRLNRWPSVSMIVVTIVDWCFYFEKVWKNSCILQVRQHNSSNLHSQPEILIGRFPISSLKKTKGILYVITTGTTGYHPQHSLLQRHAWAEK